MPMSIEFYEPLNMHTLYHFRFRALRQTGYIQPLELYGSVWVQTPYRSFSEDSSHRHQ